VGRQQDEKEFEITIMDTSESYLCKASENLLNAMVALGRKGIPSGCHGGGCGVCKIKVTSGQYRALPMSREHVSEAEERAGFALACRSHPKSNLTIEVIGKIRPAVVRNYGFV
jgi:Na+-transporting NADH:ubiquinone oxidoreductase subunit NqrF